MQRLHAYLRRVLESSANGIEDRKRFDLTAVSLFVYDYGGVYIRAKRLPVLDFRVNYGVCDGLLVPVL